MTSTTVPTRRRPERAVHETVSVASATVLRLKGLDWAVSGDESRLAHGYIGLRRAAQAVSVWDMASAARAVPPTTPAASACAGCSDPEQHPHAFDCVAAL